MILQLPNIHTDPVLRTPGSAACIWGVAGCISASTLLVRLSLLRSQDQNDARAFSRVGQDTLVVLTQLETLMSTGSELC